MTELSRQIDRYITQSPPEDDYCERVVDLLSQETVDTLKQYEETNWESQIDIWCDRLQRREYPPEIAAQLIDRVLKNIPTFQKINKQDTVEIAISQVNHSLDRLEEIQQPISPDTKLISTHDSERENAIRKLCYSIMNVQLSFNLDSQEAHLGQCPFCGAKYYNRHVSMSNITHKPECAYDLAKEISNSLLIK